jgi:hypothetical protein
MFRTLPCAGTNAVTTHSATRLRSAAFLADPLENSPRFAFRENVTFL